jgi:hypothetical protein
LCLILNACSAVLCSALRQHNTAFLALPFPGPPPSSIIKNQPAPSSLPPFLPFLLPQRTKKLSTEQTAHIILSSPIEQLCANSLFNRLYSSLTHPAHTCLPRHLQLRRGSVNIRPPHTSSQQPSSPHRRLHSPRLRHQTPSRKQSSKCPALT